MQFRPYFLIINGLLLLGQPCLSQSGYSYGRPELNSPEIPTTAAAATAAGAATPLRPLAVGFPTATSAAGASAFGGAVSGAGTGTGTAPGSAYGGYGTAGQIPRPTAPLASTAVSSFPGAAGAVLPKRPALPQRPNAPAPLGNLGIYGANVVPAAQFSGSPGGGRAVTAPGGEYEGDYSAIPGLPGVDYPIYSQVPQTNFDCAQQALPGYYSDVEAQCQTFHICALNRTYSFLCPNGTLFSQETLVCVWWNQFDCSTAPSLYANNAFIYDYGNERVPSNAGYPSGIVRQASGLLGPGASRGAAAPAAAGIFGAGSLRGTLGGGGNIGIGSGRFTPSPTAPTPQSFPGAAAAAAPGYGSVLRSGIAAGSSPSAGAGASFGGRPESAFQNAQIATASANREYLPPRRP